MLDLIKKFVTQQGQDRIRKALTTDNSSGGALIRQFLETTITNAVNRLTPQFYLMTPAYGAQKTHTFNRITALGDTTGSSQGESAVTATNSSTYQQATVDLKVTRRKGGVSVFEQEASANFTDAFAIEVDQQTRALVYDHSYLAVHGNRDANSYQYSGWDRFITTNRFSGFSSGAATVPGSQAILDAMVDASNRNGGAQHRRAWLMTPEMKSLVSRLQTNIRQMVTTQADGSARVDVGGGWRLESYRDIPIMDSTMLGGVGAVTMGTVTPSAGTAGSMSDGTYYFYVTAVTLAGESMASPQVTQVLNGGGTNQSVGLSWTAISGARAYKIYASQTTGLTTKVLIDVIAANAYDGSGTIGAATTSTVVKTLTATTAATGQDSDIPPSAVGGVKAESIYLIDLDVYQGLGKFPLTNKGNGGNGVISMLPIPTDGATLPFMLYTHGAIADAYEATSCVYRGLRVA